MPSLIYVAWKYIYSNQIRQWVAVATQRLGYNAAFAIVVNITTDANKSTCRFIH